jgi:hypothetical protein
VIDQKFTNSQENQGAELGVRGVPSWRPRAIKTFAATTLVSLALAGIAAVVGLSWRDQLPDPIATHWGLDGQPDGFGTLTGNIVVMSAVSAVFSLLFTLLGAWMGAAGGMRKAVAGLQVGQVVFLGLMLDGTLWMQLGVPDATQFAGSANLVPVVAALMGLAVGVLVAFIVPGDVRVRRSRPSTNMSLPDGQHLTWSGQVTSSLWMNATRAAATLTLVVSVLTQMLFLWLIGSALTAFLACLIYVKVRADETGLLVRSRFGWPRTFIPIDEMISARAMQVDGLGDFGGWGWRVGIWGEMSGAVGVIIRSGDALVVDQTNGRRFVVTIDDAADTASVLNAYLALWQTPSQQEPSVL